MQASVLGVILVASYLTPLSVQAAKPDSVTLNFKTVVPESTPEDATIFWAGSLNKWDPGDSGSGFSAKDYAIPAKRIDGVWQVAVTAQINSEVSYKYTRGSIFSIEEETDLTYRAARTIVFDKAKAVRDTVEAWHDIPPESLAERWPTITMESVDLSLTRDGRVMEGASALLYDKQRASLYFDLNESNTNVKGVPDALLDTVFYYLIVSDAPDNTVPLVAGKSKAEDLWHIFIDQNNDKVIDAAEEIFVADRTSDSKAWTGFIQFQDLRANGVVVDSVEVIVREATNLPTGYRSSANPEVPSLTYTLPLKHRAASLNNSAFFVSTLFGSKFSRYFWLTLDRNQDGNLDIGSGSDEVSEIDFGRMRRQQEYYLHPAFKLGEQAWEVADIDPEGGWVRLRPSHQPSKEIAIAVGKPIPEWAATTTDGATLSRSSLRGKYVLLDFWGSWCGPCIAEFPHLQQVYERFNTKAFEMVGFAYDNRASFERAMREYALPWPQVLDSTGVYTATFQVHSYPTHYLVGPEGRVLEMGNNLQGAQLLPTLEKYLK